MASNVNGNCNKSPFSDICMGCQKPLAPGEVRSCPRPSRLDLESPVPCCDDAGFQAVHTHLSQDAPARPLDPDSF